LNNEVLPRHLANLERLLEQSPSGWIAGTAGPTIADFILVPRLQWLSSGTLDGISKTILEPFPKLRALVSKVMSLPAVVAYYESKNWKSKV
jgi:glutathione S-transferase